MKLPNHRNSSVLVILTIVMGASQSRIADAQPQESYGFTPTSPADIFRSESRCGRGTLFHWNGVPCQTGGPDLSQPIVTDRPDFTEASSTVGVGVAQIELGYTYVRNNDGGTLTEIHSIGEPLLRFGVFDDWLEARIAAFPIAERTLTGAMTSRVTTVEALYVGAKVGVTPQAGALPEMALIPQATILTGSNTNTEFLPGLNWVYSWETSDNTSLAGSSQMNRRVDGSGDFYYEFAKSLSLGYSINDRLGSYVEWFGLFPQSGTIVEAEQYANGGFTYLLSDDVQWDIRIGRGLNAAAADTFVGTGLSVRFH